MALTGTLTGATSLTASLKGTEKLQARSMYHKPTTKLADMLDIDITDREEGSIIVYDSATETFIVKSRLENSSTIIVGGSF
jgi:hypothetical protein